MIYVTHDQTEALTFADQVVVMHDGNVVQVGSPIELFEHPRHTFVGHFIGSPGMNVLPCEIRDGSARFDGVALDTAATELPKPGTVAVEIGVRPEFVRFDPNGFAVEIVNVEDLGRFQVVEVRRGGHRIKLIAGEDVSIPADSPRVAFDPPHTRVYVDGWDASQAG
jgi:glycerol transport system ATP-binding protein